ncbi:transcription antitermination factor NusB [Limibacillus halophilus]
MSDKTASQATQASARRLARLAAVQALYQLEVNGGEASRVILEFLQHRLSEPIDGLTLEELDRQFFGDLVAGVSKDGAELDEVVKPALVDGWPLERLESIIRLILRCGAFELWQRPDVPARVVINEYLEVAHAFYEDKEPAFINGVLDRLAHSLRDEELDVGKA